jgi:hypothetical protein
VSLRARRFSVRLCDRIFGGDGPLGRPGAAGHFQDFSFPWPVEAKLLHRAEFQLFPSLRGVGQMADYPKQRIMRKLQKSKKGFQEENLNDLILRLVKSVT